MAEVSAPVTSMSTGSPVSSPLYFGFQQTAKLVDLLFPAWACR